MISIRGIELPPDAIATEFTASPGAIRCEIVTPGECGPLFNWSACKLLLAGWLVRVILLPLAPRPGLVAAQFAPSTTSWWQCDGEDLIYEIVANAFLYHMVRRLVCAQVVVAQGILAEQEVFDRLEGTNRTMLQGIAPPQGLVLAEVIYSDEAAWLSIK